MSGSEMLIAVTLYLEMFIRRSNPRAFICEPLISAEVLFRKQHF